MRDAEWGKIGGNYNNIVILTMNTRKDDIQMICNSLFGKDVTVVAREELQAQQYEDNYKGQLAKCCNAVLHHYKLDGAAMIDLLKLTEQLFSKLWKANKLYEDGNNTGQIYFTDDSFPKHMVDKCIEYVTERTNWLVYQEAVPQNNDHVKHEPSYTTWCIDFDGTITTSSNEVERIFRQTLLRFAKVPDLDFKKFTEERLALTKDELRQLLEDAPIDLTLTVEDLFPK